jgi:hypothetical protein
VRDCITNGVDAERIVPVVNRAPRSRHARAEIHRTVVELLAASNPGQPVLSPVFLPERKQLDDALRDGVALPEAFVAPVSQAVQARLDAVDDRTHLPGFDEPVPVEPGSLGAWDEEVAG